MITVHGPVAAVFAHRTRQIYHELLEMLRAAAIEPERTSAKDLARIDYEYPTIAGLLDQLLAVNHTGRHPLPIALYLRFSWYLNIRDLWEQKREWGLRLETLADQLDPHDHAALLNNIGTTFRKGEDLPRALDYYLRSIAVRNTDEDDLDLSYNYSNIAVAYWEMGDIDAALPYAYRALEMDRRLGQRSMEAMSLVNIAGMLYQRGQYQESLPLIEQALEIVKEAGNAYLIAEYTGQLAVHLLANLRFDEAMSTNEEALGLLREIRDEVGLARTLFNYGLLKNIFREYEVARALLAESLELMHRHRMPEADLARDWLERVNRAIDQASSSGAPTPRPAER